MMRYTLLFLFLASNYIVSAASLDTIRLNSNLSATLEFDKPIDYIVFGNNPVISVTQDGMQIYKYYDIFQDDNILIVRVKDDAPFTTLNIKLKGGELYHGFIMKSNKIEKTYYLFKSNAEMQKTQQQKAKDDSIQHTKNQIQEKFNLLLKLEHDFNDIATINNAITFQVVNMINDKQYMYFKILLNNRSSNMYTVDGVTFKMTSGKKKSLKKKEIANQNWLSPFETLLPTNSAIKAYSQDYILFAVPLYSISDGNLTVKVLEKNGNRTGDIIITADSLNKCKIF